MKQLFWKLVVTTIVLVGPCYVYYTYSQRQAEMARNDAANAEAAERLGALEAKIEYATAIAERIKRLVIAMGPITAGPTPAPKITCVIHWQDKETSAAGWKHVGSLTLAQCREKRSIADEQDPTRVHTVLNAEAVEIVN